MAEEKVEEESMIAQEIKQSIPKGTPKRRDVVRVCFVVAIALAVVGMVRKWAVPASETYEEEGTDAREFDVVVVGAGPAGSVVAARVATKMREKLGVAAPRVLLMESGSGSQRVLGGTDWMFRDRTIFDVPLAWSYVAQLSKYLWRVPGGFLARTVGGCGAHNAMLYVRALSSDIERWNASTWSWTTVKNKYLELEDWQGEVDVAQGYAIPSVGDLTRVPAHHAAGGTIATSAGIYRDLLARKFLETVAHPLHIAEGVGMQYSEDFNAPSSRRGAGYYHFNIRDGLRESAAAVFLGGSIEGYAPIPNLEFQSESTVLKLGGLGEGRVSTLDVARRGGQTKFLRPFATAAPPEHLLLAPDAVVVLAAGAILTPHLLHVSGVGDPALLRAAGLEPLVDNPAVGSGLMDHPAVGVVFDVAPALTADMVGLYSRFLNWTRGQPFSTYPRAFGYPGFSAGAFFDSGVDGENDPDLQLTVFPLQIEPHLAADQARVRYDQAIVTVAVVRPDTKYDVVPNPRDRAAPELVLRGAAPPPSSTTGGRGGIAPTDAKRLVAGVRRVREIFARSPLRDYVTKEAAPGPTVLSDDDLEAWVYATYTQNSHWCCSSNFGQNGALDPTDLSLKGVPNLRVADSSSFPHIPNGNVHSTVVAVAAEFADRLANERVDYHRLKASNADTNHKKKKKKKKTVVATTSRPK
ncbi:hypothetical protein CTAYLR_008141 [Chrysophaeum taylorii]|uniref:Glucose-methanol-choline oxidoreductase N-terminal domain-containing protein n=1 Tax=Chrysophaeum taylorii TaxID=2483200 RepID=A0AAD7XPY8_9STRA|nr:hypothetical protein CTAYLR_008141 [Chrysophaeum taylorii]